MSNGDASLIITQVALHTSCKRFSVDSKLFSKVHKELITFGQQWWKLYKPHGIGWNWFLF